MFRELIKNSSIVLLSLVCLCLALELVVRAYSHFFFPRMMEVDDQLGWRHAPNREKIFVNELGEPILVRQNNLGFRGPYYDPAQRSGITRVLVLGDSFTEAVQVAEEQTFVGRLGAINLDLQLLNAGVGGYGTVQQYRYLELNGEELDPDVILVVAYDNDLADNCLSHYPSFGPRPYARTVNGTINVEELQPEDFGRFVLRLPFWSVLNEHSYLYGFLNSRIYQALRSTRMRELNRLDLALVEQCEKGAVLDAMFAALASRSADLSAALGIVFIPSADDARTGTSRASAMVLEICDRRRLECLSLLDALHESIELGLRPYFEHDIHWTADGHRVAADAIAPFLERLVPRSSANR